MTIDYQTMLRMLSQVIWPIGRLSGFILTVPIFSSSLVPTRIKVFFLFTLTWICAPFVPEQLSFVHFNGHYIGYMMQELLFGLLMGFVLQLVFQVFVLVGQIISMQAGLGFAVMVDPSTKSSMPLISQLYLMLVTLIFLALNGHLALLELLIKSFEVMPVGQVSVDSSLVWKVITFSGWMFKQAVLISIPAILTLLIVTLSFGVTARVAPQLNVFSLGFPISILVGILVIKIGLSPVGAQIASCIEQGLVVVKGMVH